MPYLKQRKTHKFETAAESKELKASATNKNLWKSNCVIVLLVVICYGNSLKCGLVFDDVPAIVENDDLRPQTSYFDLLKHDFWGTPLLKEESHKSYRPVCVLSFRLNFWLHELDPIGYHFVNVILYVITTLLYYRLCLQFLPFSGGFLATVLFAVHPIHTEAVTGVVGRSELLCSIFFLLALRLYLNSFSSKRYSDQHFFAVFFLLTVLAMLSKEQGIVVTGVCGIYDIVLVQKSPNCGISEKSPRRKVKGPTPTWKKDLVLRLLLLCCCTTALLLYRLKIMGTKLPVFNKFDNPASVAATPIRQLTYNYLLALNNWLLLFPSDLLCDWTMGTVPLVMMNDYRNVGTILFYLTLFALIWRCWKSSSKHCRVMTIGLGLWTIPFLPASNLFFPVGFVIAERVLFLPSMGFCLLVGYGWDIIWNRCKRKMKTVMTISIIFIVCLNIVKVIHRNFEWMSQESLFKSGLRITQHNAKLWNNLGHVLEGRGDHESALKHFQKAADIQQDDLGSYLNMGRAYNALEMYKEAEEAFWKAKSLLPKAKSSSQSLTYVAPRHLDLFRHLADLLAKNDSRLHEAEQLYKEAINLKKDFTAAYMNRASILLKLNRSSEAHDTYKQALKHDRTNPDIFYNIGVLLLKEGNNEQALKNFDRALTINPEHEKSLINYAILSQDAGDSNLRKTAQERLEGILKKGTLPPERIFFNLGMLAMEDKEYKSAEEYFKRAIEQKSSFDTALFNIAFLLYNTNRALEAVPYLEKLVKTHEHHSKGLMLLGNIYFSDMKNYTAAKECYKRILMVNNAHVPALHNLCAVYVQLHQFQTAEDCLLKALDLAPAEEYIKDHLKIVRERLKDNRRSQETLGTENTPCDNQTCYEQNKLSRRNKSQTHR